MNVDCDTDVAGGPRHSRDSDGGDEVSMSARRYPVLSLLSRRLKRISDQPRTLTPVH